MVLYSFEDSKMMELTSAVLVSLMGKRLAAPLCHILRTAPGSLFITLRTPLQDSSLNLVEYASMLQHSDIVI